MAKGQRGYNAKTVLKAVDGCNGLMTVVAKRLECDWTTAKRYVNKYKQAAELFQTQREKITDVAENNVITKINEGDWNATTYWLNTIGRSRGFGLHGDTIPIDGKIELEIVKRSAK